MKDREIIKKKLILSQTGSGALQFPLGRQVISEAPINAFPL